MGIIGGVPNNSLWGISSCKSNKKKLVSLTLNQSNNTSSLTHSSQENGEKQYY